MSARHSPATRRIQSRLEQLELQHLRDVTSELAEQVEELDRRARDAEGALDAQWRGTVDMAARLEAEGSGYLGLTRDGSLCAIFSLQVVDDFGSVVYLARPQ